MRDREKESVNLQSDSLTVCVCTVNVNMIRDCSYGHGFVIQKFCSNENYVQCNYMYVHIYDLNPFHGSNL